MARIRISGVGCCLLDRIYDNIDFQSEAFRKYWSKKAGDGGLEPGKLTFEEELERFSGQSFAKEILPLLTKGQAPQKENVGGPCIVALINASQLAYKESEVSFYGCRGEDEVADKLLQKLQQTRLDLSHYRVEKGCETASTSVLSDPNYDNGHGERTFVNTIGASWNYLPEEVDESFYDSDICVFGSTALVPRIHKGLVPMLKKAKAKGKITVVNTVYDFLSEKEHPDKRWPMGDSDESYKFIDLLLVDHEEALRFSGCEDIPSAIAFFREKGTGAVIVTNGAQNIYLWADSPLFGKVEEQTMPVSKAVGEALKQGKKGDSTGCGDNFAGGVIGSLAKQIYNSKLSSLNSQLSLDLVESSRWGIVSGGFACFYYGGTYLEEKEGEKFAQLKALYDQYIKQ
jgi:sugar/nucleoside kinase (ribokinase family)